MSLSDEERSIITLYRCEKALTAIEEAKECSANTRYSLAIQRLYYAVYYAASALLVKMGFKIQTHAGVHSMLHKELVLTGKLTIEEGRTYGRLLQMRHTGDYDDCFDFTQKDVDEILPKAVTLTNKLIALQKG